MNFTPPLWYDKQGNVIDARTVERLQQQEGYKRVGGTIVMSGSDPAIPRLWVSTVWLGLDHSFAPTDAPLIFETMVFEDGGGGADLDCHRYATESEAITGHELMVKAIMDRIPNAVTLEDSSGDGFFLDPEERRRRLAEMATQAEALMLEMRTAPEAED